MKKFSNPPPPPMGDRPEAPPPPPSLRNRVEGVFNALNNKVSKQELRIEELENPLRYYGDSDNYELRYDAECHGGASANIDYDGRRRARKVLYGE